MAIKPQTSWDINQMLVNLPPTLNRALLFQQRKLLVLTLALVCVVQYETS